MAVRDFWGGSGNDTFSFSTITVLPLVQHFWNEAGTDALFLATLFPLLVPELISASPRFFFERTGQTSAQFGTGISNVDVHNTLVSYSGGASNYITLPLLVMVWLHSRL